MSGGGGAGGAPSPDIVNITQPPPVLAISVAHAGASFTNGQNATITISVMNSGGTAAPANTVFVQDIMPSGLSIISASGTNWSCGGSPGSMSCQSANPLPANSTSPITATGAVHPTAPSLSNTA